MKKILHILLGCFVTTVGLILLKHSNTVTGGTAGLSLSATYLTHIPFALIFFLVNLPFYIFSVIMMGWKFTLSTLLSVTVLSIMTGMDHWLPEFSFPMWMGAIMGGLIIGIGVSIIFINGASLGGANILALHLQKRFDFNPGKTNFLFDLLVVLSSIYTVGLLRGLCSILSIAITAKVIDYFKHQIADKHKAPQMKEKYSLQTSSPQVSASR